MYLDQQEPKTRPGTLEKNCIDAYLIISIIKRSSVNLLLGSDLQYANNWCFEPFLPVSNSLFLFSVEEREWYKVSC